MEIKNYISSGVIEQYLLGSLSKAEELSFEAMRYKYAEIEIEIVTISDALEQLALENAIEPTKTIKPFIMATIDFMERMENGEEPSFPPILNNTLSLDDYATWINRADMILPETAGDLYAKIIGYTPQATTAIAWIKGNAPVETHDKEYEKFLIVEGTCDIVVEEKVYQLVAGDFFAIPLHKPHQVRVTSSIACKVILQRIAA